MSVSQHQENSFSKLFFGFANELMPKIAIGHE